METARWSHSLAWSAVLLLLMGGCMPSEDAADSEAPCRRGRVPHVRPEVRAIAFPRGDGPVYVGLGTGGVVHYTEDNRRHRAWYYHKTLWAIAPDYRAAVTISGHQVDGPGVLRFNHGGFPGDQLRRLSIPAGSGEWRYGPSDTLLRAPGCYAFEIRGPGLGQTIPFLARR
jgi:hypothetical protein